MRQLFRCRRIQCNLSGKRYNRIFASYRDILDHCCAAWNKLTDQPWLIMSIGLRDWAYRF